MKQSNYRKGRRYENGRSTEKVELMRTLKMENFVYVGIFSNKFRPESSFPITILKCFSQSMKSVQKGKKQLTGPVKQELQKLIGSKIPGFRHLHVNSVLTTQDQTGPKCQYIRTKRNQKLEIRTRNSKSELEIETRN